MFFVIQIDKDGDYTPNGYYALVTPSGLEIAIKKLKRASVREFVPLVKFRAETEDECLDWLNVSGGAEWEYQKTAIQYFLMQLPIEQVLGFQAALFAPMPINASLYPDLPLDDFTPEKIAAWQELFTGWTADMLFWFKQDLLMTFRLAREAASQKIHARRLAG